MRRDLKRRIERLERDIGKQSLPWFVVTTRRTAKLTLGPGERVVEDWLSADNGFLITEERITTDPNDFGKRCKQKLDWGRKFFEPLDEAMPAIECWTIDNAGAE